MKTTTNPAKAARKILASVAAPIKRHVDAYLPA